MSAALLAMDHFNNRNDSVVPELSSLTSGCNVRFDTNRSQFFDTGTYEHWAAKDVWKSEIEPCAIAGPFNDIPAIDLSVVALSGEIPLVVPRALNDRVGSNDLSPFTTLVHPSTKAAAKNMVDYLLYKNRNDFIGVMYSLTETGVQRHEALATELNNKRFNWTGTSFDISDIATGDSAKALDKFRDAMKRIKDSGYRTIVVYMDFPWFELPILADAAEELGMNQGDYFWIWFGSFDPGHVFNETSSIRNILEGSSLIIPYSMSYLNDSSPFTTAYKSQGKAEVDRLNAVNPISPDDVGYVFAQDDWFEDVSIEYLSGKTFRHIASLFVSRIADTNITARRRALQTTCMIQLWLLGSAHV